MKQYFAYIRVSTVKQGEHGSSLQEQRSAIEAYASRQNLSIAEWFEEKETAAKQGRAVFSRMLGKLEKGEAQGIIIHKIDRSARNLKDWANLGDLIDRGIDVHFAHDSVDLRSRGGRLSADIQAVVAADYIRNLREEVLKGLHGRLNQGVYPFAAPVGYLNRGKGRVKEIDPIRASLVREAFELYATGAMGLKDLRKEMKRRGLTTARSGRPLSLQSVSRMLNNPFYIGLIRIRRTGETYQGKHVPLISKALFDRVQDVLKGKLVLRKVKHDFLFRRAVRCEGCGHHLIGERHKGQFTYYRCHSDRCGPLYVREEALEHEIQTQLAFLECDELERQALNEEAALLNADAAEAVRAMKATLAMQIARCDDRLGRLTDAFIDQTIEKELFEARKRHVLGEQRALRDRLEKASEATLPVSEALQKLELGNAALFGYRNGNQPEKRAILDAVTSNLSVSGKRPMVELKSPFREVSNWRKSQQCAPHRGTPRDRAKQLLDIVMAVDQVARNVPNKKTA